MTDYSQTPEEFWYNNLAKYYQQEDPEGFPQNLCVTALTKMAHTDVALYKGYLKNGDSLIIIHPTSNHGVKNFLGVGIADCDYTADTSVRVYELDYPDPMTHDFVFSLLTDSHGWDIKDYGDLSGY